jgi:hypothetical protein
MTMTAAGAALPSRKLAVTNSDKNQFVGTWKLISSEIQDSNGKTSPDPDFGPGSGGYLIYDNTGHMCVQLTSPDRAKWKSDASPTADEAKASITSYDTYCGTYDVDEKRGVVTHHTDMSLNPNVTGKDLVRHYSISGNQLTLRMQDTSFDGSVHNFIIKWQRANAAPSTQSVADKSAASCLPADTKPDEVVSLEGSKNTPVTVAQKLKELGAKCSAKGQLMNAKGRPIYFYHLTGCWGMAPPNRDEILENQARKIAELEKTYQVIPMTCNPTGADIP